MIDWAQPGQHSGCSLLMGALQSLEDDRSPNGADALANVDESDRWDRDALATDSRQPLPRPGYGELTIVAADGDTGLWVAVVVVAVGR